MIEIDLWLQTFKLFGHVVSVTWDYDDGYVSLSSLVTHVFNWPYAFC